MLEFDLCVVGAGPAGLAMAAELDGGPYRVCVLEAGGRRPDADVQRLADVDLGDNPDCYENPIHLHAMAVGGTAHRWCVEVDGELYVRLAKLSAGDFEQRSWLKHSGWPIGLKDLDPYYTRALNLCGVDNTGFDELAWEDARRHPVLSSTQRMTSLVYLFARQGLFVDELPRRLAGSRNVVLLRRSVCVELRSVGGGAQVTSARVRTMGGGEFFVAARGYALAQGAFDVPRLLLASNGDVRAGLGNQHDLVGRFLTDHQIVKAGPIVTDRKDLPARLAYYDIRAGRQGYGTGALTLASKTLEEEQIMSSALMFAPADGRLHLRAAESLFGRRTSAHSPAVASALTLKQSVAERRRPPQLGRHLLTMVKGADEIAFTANRYFQVVAPRWSIDNGGWSEPAESGEPAAKVGPVEAFQICEQAPDPENRVQLSDETDAVGMRKGKVRFGWGRFDRFSAVRAQEIFGQELAASGVGVLGPRRRRGEPLVRQLSAHHPAGTTRMSDDPATGVVDSNGRVHNTSNLFVASSAVFPTAGFAPPTLTILAWAMRLADHLSTLLASEGLPPL